MILTGNPWIFQHKIVGDSSRIVDASSSTLAQSVTGWGVINRRSSVKTEENLGASFCHRRRVLAADITGIELFRHMSVCVDGAVTARVTLAAGLCFSVTKPLPDLA